MFSFLLRFCALFLLTSNLGGGVLTASSYSIVFVHIGDTLPSYAKTAFAQARLFNPDCSIFILAKESVLAELSKQENSNNIVGINYDNLIKTEEHEKFILSYSVSNQNQFWRYTSERFLYLYDFIRQYELQNVFHLENDNMLYVNLQNLLPVFRKYYPGIGATFDNDGRCIAGFIYISNPAVMKKLASCFAHYASAQSNSSLNDMKILALFKDQTDSNTIEHLPIIMSEYACKHELITPTKRIAKNGQKYFHLSDVFHSIFDAAALGQYLGGIDPIHANNQPGFINESCVFNPSLLVYEWEPDFLGRLVPYALYDGAKYRINNLHIHSKRLEQFTSFK